MTKSKLLVFTFAILIITTAVPVFAGPVPSRAVAPAIDRSGDLSAVRDAVAVKGVSDALAAQGFSSDEINTRLASLSDQDLHSLAQNVEQIQAAGINRQQWIWIGIGALAVALLVALTS
ncbi:MAG: PA2779 family protein [Acidobacteriota bacterium]